MKARVVARGAERAVGQIERRKGAARRTARIVEAQTPRPAVLAAGYVKIAAGLNHERSDYQAAVERVRAAEAERRAAATERYPAVRVNADYGAIGVTPADAVGTYTVLGAVEFPIFQGGRIRGRLAETDAALRSRRAEADDVKAE